MTGHADLNPAEFADTANAVMAACRDAAGAPARARLLGEAGLLGVLAPESAGGMALPIAFAVPVLEAAGFQQLEYPLLEAMLLARAFGDEPGLARAIVTGECRPTIAWSGEPSADAGRVGRAPLGATATHVLVLQAGGGALLVRTDGPGVEGRDAGSLDLIRPEHAFAVSASAGGAALNTERLADLLADAVLLRTTLILGHADACLRSACEYADQRQQFGRALSANQAISHRLARHGLAVETIRSAITRASSVAPHERTLATWAAFAGACELGPAVCEGAIQVFGGMGFTWELPVHRHLRSIRTLATQGAVTELRDRIADHLFQASAAWLAGGNRHAGR
ncbi:MAG: acyl-CoA dehydrogenase family protein [Burkholderiaceae bacterium]